MYKNVIEMFRRVRLHQDRFTFPCVLKACCELLDFGLSCLVHAQIIVQGFGSHVFVQNGQNGDAWELLKMFSQRRNNGATRRD